MKRELCSENGLKLDFDCGCVLKEERRRRDRREEGEEKK
jgi:hypothetical protein